MPPLGWATCAHGGRGFTALAPPLAHLRAVGIATLTIVAQQVSIEGCWRVGEGANGTLVTGSLFNLSRNPTLVAKGASLARMTLALPPLPAIFAVLLGLAAHLQSEDRALTVALGEPYRADYYPACVPHWMGRPAAGGAK